jgi:hypothetical protein
MTEVKSEIKEEPLFSLKNFLRPTSKNVLIWATTIKGLSITGMASSFAVANKILFFSFMILGGLAEAFIYFTREKPSETLMQAVVDIKQDSIDGHVE